MATHLDLEEQEQLDQLKDFWKSYGNLIMWVAILSLIAFIGYTFWTKQQSEQAAKASLLFEELDKVVVKGDLTKADRITKDLVEHFPKTIYAAQGSLLVGKLQADQQQFDPASKNLTWAIEHASTPGYRDMARLRLAALLIEQKKYPEAKKVLTQPFSKEFEGLADDRRGDLAQLEGKTTEAVLAYQRAWKAMDSQVPYKKVVGAKLTALGAAPATDLSGS